MFGPEPSRPSAPRSDQGSSGDPPGPSLRRTCLACGAEIDTEPRPGAEPICPGCGELFCAPTAVADEGATRISGPEETTDWTEPYDPAAGPKVPPHPVRLGRYAIKKLIGRGGFGLIYLAHDGALDRPVAIKLFRRERFTPRQIEQIFDEARITAGLKHPRIVSIFDFGHADDGSRYLVLEYIEGHSLADLLQARPLSPTQAVDLLIEVAEAVHHAHSLGFLHRDLKPSNILIDTEGRPHVADFGLAVHEHKLRRLSAQTSGTPAYMAPEQVRGESHRLDGRTDVWSLGVMFYEMLVGERPFRGARQRLFDEILCLDPKPPRQVDDRVPPELEYICLKCLSKRMTDRYASAAQLASDLKQWRESVSVGGTPASAGTLARNGAGLHVEPPPAQVVPKSLHAYDAEDRDFFLKLLPGPRDRTGLPESVRFWLNRIEETDPDETFSVGLILGPSGCGKTSLVKAALLPRLGDRHIVAYLESTPEGTEARALTRLRKLCPGLDTRLDLVETLAALRLEPELTGGRKVVIVIDQLEQWLHAKRRDEDRALARALRHCDGRSVQGLLLVRDDFGMLAARFMDELEVPIVQGFNFATVDLFDRKHAREVLCEFGRAFGRLPDATRPLGPDQERFLDEAVAGLAEDGKVLCVRLALFAETIKGEPWTLATLKQVGGPDGIGASFLEGVLGDRATNPDYRRHREAARAVLKRLLPEPGSPIKGHRRSRRELLEASGYTARPADFDHLMRLLDHELRLVTPVEPEDVAEASGPSAADDGDYQLTHDYLVYSLGRWLSRRQRETWRGRAELCLEDRTAQWKRSREDRYLPSLAEFLAIVCGVPRNQRSPDQRAMLRAARRYHGLRWGAAALLALAIGLGVQRYAAGVWARAEQARCETLVDSALTAPPEALPYTLENLRPLRARARPMLRARLAAAPASSRDRLHAALALAALGEVDRGLLIDAIADAPDHECGNFVDALRAVRSDVLSALAHRLRTAQSSKSASRYAAVLLHLGDPTGAQTVVQAGSDPSSRTAFIHELAGWHADLRDLPTVLHRIDDSAFRSGLCAALGRMPRDALSAQERSVLTEVLADLFRSAPDGATHSAAFWALRQWGIEPPSLETPDRRDRGWFVNSRGVTFVRVPAGTFTMGRPATQHADPHTVTLSRPYFISDREIARELYEEYLDDPNGGSPGSPRPNQGVSPGPDYPAQNVSWIDAVSFCNWLSRQEGRRPCYERTGSTEPALNERNGKTASVELWRCDFEADGYRLPTEAEWEYACRAGTSSAYFFGDSEDDLDAHGVFSRSHAAPCGEKLPNALGLFDVHGNVREWCWDWYTRKYPTGDAIDPTGPRVSAAHVHRGGSWYDLARACQSAERNQDIPTFRDSLLGFRIVTGASRDGK